MVWLVTRPLAASNDLCQLFTSQHIPCHASPLVDFAPGRQLAALPDLLSWANNIIAVSQQSLSFLPTLPWPDCRYFAVGETTALALQQHCQYPVLWQAGSDSEALLQHPLLQTSDVAGQHILILRGNGGRETLANTLRQRGGQIIYAECYQRQYQPLNQQAQQLMAEQKLKGLIVTSSELLYHLATQLNAQQLAYLQQQPLIVVSERTAQQACLQGWQQVHCSNGANNQQLLAAVQRLNT